MGRGQLFFAVAFRGDPTSPGRLWVCARGKGAPVGAGWSGCWSRDSAVLGADLQQFLRTLEESVTRGGRSGPFGPYLEDHYFFEGWDSWGSGVPAPLADIRPDEAVESAVSAASIGELVEYIEAHS